MQASVTKSMKQFWNVKNLKFLIFLDQVSIYSNGTVADSRLHVDLDMTGIS